MQVSGEDGTGLRTPSTSFVGRRDELGRLRNLIASSRLLTITGPGGSGKTRLAEELVRQLSRSLGEGLALAYLAGSDDPIGVADIVAASVGLRGRGDPAAAVVAYLRTRRFLLVLDNCEHVHDAAARLAADILASCPRHPVPEAGRRDLRIPGSATCPASSSARPSKSLASPS